jgi:hypothetical protein
LDIEQRKIATRGIERCCAVNSRTQRCCAVEEEVEHTKTSHEPRFETPPQITPFTPLRTPFENLVKSLELKAETLPKEERERYTFAAEKTTIR